MSKNFANEGLLKRFPLLSWLGALLCFVVVPFFLIDTAIERTLQLRSDKEIAATFREMDNRLEFLLRHCDDKHYFHSLFKRIFDRAVRSSDPVKSVAQGITFLRRRFPQGLKFIVWDGNGQKVESLSDEKSFHYIVRNLLQMFREVADHCKSNYPGYPETLPVVSDKVHIFRSYLGRFLVPAHLRLPYQAGVQGACVMADTLNRMPLFWFHSEPELTWFCGIHGDVLNQNLGLKHSIETLNRSGDIISGIVSNNQVLPAADEAVERELLLELGKFENASLPHRQTATNLYAFKLLDPDTRGFCRLPRASLSFGLTQQVKSGYIGRLLGALLLFAFVLYCYQLRLGRIKLSIRLKLAGLFLYATGLPLLILGTIGYEYLQQQRFSLISRTHAANEKMLLEIDAGYGRHRNRMGQFTEAELAGFRQEMLEKEPDSGMTDVYDRLLKNLGAEEIHFFNQSGQILASHKRHRKMVSQAFMKIFAAAALTFANQKVDDLFDQLVESSGSNLKLAGKKVVERGASALKTLLTRLERIENFVFGTQMKLCYTTLLGDRLGRRFHSLMIIVWREDEAQRDYIASLIDRYNRRSNATLLAATVFTDGLTISPGIKSGRRLLPILQKAAALQNVSEDELQIDGKTYIATAIGGKALNNLALVALSPVSVVEEEIDQLKFYLGLSICIILAISVGVALSLSNQFLAPVQQLAEAVLQIGRRNFRYRTGIGSNDEFGDLGKVFDTSMEELEELEIGRVVQENLFPGNRFSAGAIEVFARTVSMTRLGGDYYDFFKVDDNLVGVFMGDVAGHGIPAALIMAMAKASVQIRTEERRSPSRLLTAIHQMLFSLKSNNFKRMMTCQYMTFNGADGELTIANAGHCFPVIVTGNGNASSYQEIIGSPVGIAKRARYSDHQLKLEPGDTVILYSDGMLEASNVQFGAFGADRLLQLALEAYSDDLATYYQNMFAANQKWAEKSEDDLTIVLIRYGKAGVTHV